MRLLIAILIAVVAAAEPTVLERLANDPELWTRDARGLAREYPTLRFRWVDQGQTTARGVPVASGGFLGADVAEILLRFADGKVAEAVYNIYTRGDVGDIGMAAFAALGKTVEDRMDAYAGVAGKKTRGYHRKGIRRDGRRWVGEAIAWEIESSYTRDNGEERPEYLRLRFSPPGAANAPDAETEVDPEAQVRRDDNGDVWIPNVPMVDQGQKGYCAVAVTERVLRYFGQDVDQHQLAQVAASDGVAGTDPESLIAALKRFSVQFGARVHELDTAEYFTTHGVKKLVRDYNSMARRMDRPKIDRPSGMIDLAAVFRSMDPEVFLAVQTKSDLGRRRFWREVTRQIDDGIPVMWSVMLGFVPEPGLPQVFGGHMRLIIGYNETTGEIVYTDTWGRGHEQKRMSADHAQAITTGLFTLTPR